MVLVAVVGGAGRGVIRLQLVEAGAGLGDEPVHAFRRVGVELSDGNDFGPLGAGHVRVNLATSLPILEQTVAAMATVRPLG